MQLYTSPQKRLAFTIIWIIHQDHPTFSHIFASRFAQVKLIDLGRSGNAGGSPQPRWRRGTQRIRPRDVNGGSWENPWGKLIDEKSSKKMTIFFFVAMLKLINYDYKRFFLLKLTRIDDVEIDVVLLAVLV